MYTTLIPNIYVLTFYRRKLKLNCRAARLVALRFVTYADENMCS